MLSTLGVPVLRFLDEALGLAVDLLGDFHEFVQLWCELVEGE